MSTRGVADVAQDKRRVVRFSPGCNGQTGASRCGETQKDLSTPPWGTGASFSVNLEPQTAWRNLPVKKRWPNLEKALHIKTTRSWLVEWIALLSVGLVTAGVIVQFIAQHAGAACDSAIYNLSTIIVVSLELAMLMAHVILAVARVLLFSVIQQDASKACDAISCTIKTVTQSSSLISLLPSIDALINTASAAHRMLGSTCSGPCFKRNPWLFRMLVITTTVIVTVPHVVAGFLGLALKLGQLQCAVTEASVHGTSWTQYATFVLFALQVGSLRAINQESTLVDWIIASDIEATITRAEALGSEATACLSANDLAYNAYIHSYVSIVYHEPFRQALSSACLQQYGFFGALLVMLTLSKPQMTLFAHEFLKDHDANLNAPLAAMSLMKKLDARLLGNATVASETCPGLQVDLGPSLRPASIIEADGDAKDSESSSSDAWPDSVHHPSSSRSFHSTTDPANAAALEAQTACIIGTSHRETPRLGVQLPVGAAGHVGNAAEPTGTNARVAIRIESLGDVIARLRTRFADSEVAHAARHLVALPDSAARTVAFPDRDNLGKGRFASTAAPLLSHRATPEAARSASVGARGSAPLPVSTLTLPSAIVETPEASERAIARPQQPDASPASQISNLNSGGSRSSSSISSSCGSSSYSESLAYRTDDTLSVVTCRSSAVQQRQETVHSTAAVAVTASGAGSSLGMRPDIGGGRSTTRSGGSHGLPPPQTQSPFAPTVSAVATAAVSLPYIRSPAARHWSAGAASATRRVFVQTESPQPQPPLLPAGMPECPAPSDDWAPLYHAPTGSAEHSTLPPHPTYRNHLHHEEGPVYPAHECKGVAESRTAAGAEPRLASSGWCRPGHRSSGADALPPPAAAATVMEAATSPRAGGALLRGSPARMPSWHLPMRAGGLGGAASPAKGLAPIS